MPQGVAAAARSGAARLQGRRAPMGCPTKVQRIDRKDSQQWYINFPAAIAQAMQFDKGEVVEWIVEDKQHLILKRQRVPASPVQVKKKRLL